MHKMQPSVCVAAVRKLYHRGFRECKHKLRFLCAHSCKPSPRAIGKAHTLSGMIYVTAFARRFSIFATIGARNDPYLVRLCTHVVSMNVMLNALDATLQLLVLRRQDDVS